MDSWNKKRADSFLDGFPSRRTKSSNPSAAERREIEAGEARDRIAELEQEKIRSAERLRQLEERAAREAADAEEKLKRIRDEAERQKAEADETLRRQAAEAATREAKATHREAWVSQLLVQEGERKLREMWEEFGPRSSNNTAQSDTTPAPPNENPIEPNSPSHFAPQPAATPRPQKSKNAPCKSPANPPATPPKNPLPNAPATSTKRKASPSPTEASSKPKPATLTSEQSSAPPETRHTPKPQKKAQKKAKKASAKTPAKSAVPGAKPKASAPLAGPDPQPESRTPPQLSAPPKSPSPTPPKSPSPSPTPPGSPGPPPGTAPAPEPTALERLLGEIIDHAFSRTPAEFRASIRKLVHPTVSLRPADPAHVARKRENFLTLQRFKEENKGVARDTSYGLIHIELLEDPETLEFLCKLLVQLSEHPHALSRFSDYTALIQALPVASGVPPKNGKEYCIYLKSASADVPAPAGTTPDTPTCDAPAHDPAPEAPAPTSVPSLPVGYVGSTWWLYQRYLGHEARRINDNQSIRWQEFLDANPEATVDYRKVMVIPLAIARDALEVDELAKQDLRSLLLVGEAECQQDLGLVEGQPKENHHLFRPCCMHNSINESPLTGRYIDKGITPRESAYCRCCGCTVTCDSFAELVDHFGRHYLREGLIDRFVNIHRTGRARLAQKSTTAKERVLERSDAAERIQRNKAAAIDAARALAAEVEENRKKGPLPLEELAVLVPKPVYEIVSCPVDSCDYEGSDEGLKRHDLLEHTPEEDWPFSCSRVRKVKEKTAICGKRFCSSWELENHKAECGVKRTLQEMQKDGTYKCVSPDCILLLPFPNIEESRAHDRLVHQHANFVCRVPTWGEGLGGICGADYSRGQATRFFTHGHSLNKAKWRKEWTRRVHMRALQVQWLEARGYLILGPSDTGATNPSSASVPPEPIPPATNITIPASSSSEPVSPPTTTRALITDPTFLAAWAKNLDEGGDELYEG